MKYVRIKEESREYKYGPGEEYEAEDKAELQMKLLRTHIYTELILKGFRTSIEEIKIVRIKGKNAFKLTTTLRVPIQIFEQEEEE